MSNNIPIKEEEFLKLYDENILKKEYDKIIDKIDIRFAHIITTIIEIKGKQPKKDKNKDYWYDYGNLSYDSEESGGYFDPKCYKKDIEFGGEYFNIPPPFESSFPTKWLWEKDFLEQFKNAVEAYERIQTEKKQKISQKYKIKQEKKKEMKEIISKKLTAEELRYIDFKR